MKKVLTVLLAIALLCSLSLSAIAENDLLTIAVNNDPDTLNPGIANSNARYERLVYSGLVGFVGHDIVGDLADSWEVSEDGIVWTFHLKDAYFHSGKKLTAADVKATYERYLDPEHPLTHSAKMNWIKEVQVIDDNTAAIVCNGPYALALSTLAGHYGLILNADDIAKYGSDLGKTIESIDGTGPYKLVEHIWGDSYTFVKNDNFYGTKPTIEKLHFKVIPDASARTIALETGAVDLVCGVNASDVPMIENTDGLNIVYTESNGQFFFMYNCSEYSICHDPKVRVAINHAVDVATIVDVLYAEVRGEVPNSFATARDYGTEDLGVISYDPELSKQLLAEAGYPDGITVKLFASSIYTKNPESAEIAKAMAAEAGINIEITTGDNVAFHELFGHSAEEFRDTLGYDMFCMGQGPSSCDLGGYQGLYTTDTRSNQANYGFYSNAEVDELFAKQAVETNTEARLALLHRLNEILYLEDPVGLLIWNDATPFALNDRIANFEGNVSIMGDVDYKELKLVD